MFVAPFLIYAALGLPDVLASSILSPRVIHEQRRDVPAGWHPARRAESASVIPLRFGLAQSNLDKLDEFLMDVSHPDSPKYGQHWTTKEVADAFRPSQDAVHAVHSWLTGNGVDHERVELVKSGSWIQATVTIEEAEALLGTEYYVYQHETGEDQHLACAEKYHLPEHVSKHVEIVTPTLHFDVLHNRRNYEAPALISRGSTVRDVERLLPAQSGPKVAGVVTELSSSDLSNCSAQITPACLRALYNFDYTPVTKNNSIAIIEYTPQAYIASDLDLFFSNFSPSQIGQRPNLSSIDGGYIQTNASESGIAYNGESNLDLQYAMALVGSEQPVQLYQTGDGVELVPGFDNMLNALDASYCTFEGGNDPAYDAIYPDPDGGYQGSMDCGTVTPAYVMSTSYQFDEAQFTPFYMERQCAEYAKLGLMGITVIYVSGDRGVGGGSGDCLYPNGTLAPGGSAFSPTFPSTCPYVTSVGATQMKPGASVNDPEPESACETVIYSSGGWSNVFAMPSYQADAVSGYLEKYPPPYPGTLWNSTGTSRAFPDVSANGANYMIALQGQYQLVSGTSAAGPTFAAIISAVNDARLAVGKGPVGFINPIIYSEQGMAAFNDITNGTNPGCDTEGFSAELGWDPVTGLGTPNFPKLLQLFLGLT